MSLSKDERLFQILIVDSPNARFATKVAIKTALENCQFTEAKNLEEAKNIIDETVLPFDLAIIDEELGRSWRKKEGIIIKDKICKRNPHANIITISARPGTRTELLKNRGIEATSRISKTEMNYTQILIDSVKKSLYKPIFRMNLNRQYKALSCAKESFDAHREKWIMKYGGRFVLVSEGNVVEEFETSTKMREALGNYEIHETMNMAVLKIPADNIHDV